MTPTLTTTHLVLHQQTTVFPQQVEWLNDLDVMRYSEQRHREHTKATCRQYVRSFDHQMNHLWSIHNLDKEFVGTITAYRDEFNQIANMGILIGKPYQGRHYGKEAWQAVMDWLLTQGVRKIEAGAMAVNEPMLKIFRSTWMQLEAEQKNHFLWNNQVIGLLQYAKFK